MDAGIITNYNDAMNSSIDPDKIRIPAFLRKKAIVRQVRQQLILTALDRKMAGLGVHSKKPLALITGKNTALKSMRNNFQKPENEDEKVDFPQEINISAGPSYGVSFGHFLIVPIGTVVDYYDKIQVAVIRLKETLRLGDVIQITAEDFLFQQPVESMQINRKHVKMAKKKAEIGLKVLSQPQIKGAVYKVVPAETKKAAYPQTSALGGSKNSKTFSQPLF